MTEHPENTLLVDIGTNGEMALFSQGRLLCCSTAAGPAFEGAGLTMGMNALAGAIDRVGLSGGMLVTHTIGGGAARGVCGSGVIDALAALLTAGALDETGLLDEEHALVAEYQDEPAAQLAPGVYLTGRDVRALQLAKSAICAGMLTLIHHAGLTPEEIGTLYQCQKRGEDLAHPPCPRSACKGDRQCRRRRRVDGASECARERGCRAHRPHCRDG